MKIPWTNIYKERTQVIIKGLYLLAIPNQAVVYDAEKEKMAAMEAKQKQLALIEEAKLRESSGIIYSNIYCLISYNVLCY